MHIDILDDDNHPVPQGVIGYLVVTGFGVSQGYVNEAEVRSDFLPYLISDTERSYITGDYGYIGENAVVILHEGQEKEKVYYMHL